MLSSENRLLVQKCSTCHDQCMAYTPELKFLHNQSYVTSRKAQLIDFVERGLTELDEEAAEIIYSALNTGLQKYNCIFTEDGIDEADYIHEIRAELVRKRILPSAIKKLLEQARQGSIYGETLAGLPVVRGEGEVALVFEGASRLYTPRAREAAVSVFQSLGKDCAIIDIPSCGYTEWDLGFLEESQRCVDQLLQLFNRHGIKTVVSIDPAIVAILREYGTLNVMHFSEYVEQQIISLSENEIIMSVVYHDPSELARYLNITEEPRAILKRVPGITYNEFAYHHEQAKPTGGRFGYLYREKSLVLAEERIAEAKRVGAEVIITAAPFDYLNLSVRSNGLKIMDYAEFVDLLFEQNK